MEDIQRDAVELFIAKWQGVAASELSTSQSFLLDLCRLLGVDTPHPTPEQDYMFERPITFAHGDGSTSAGRIDLYRRGAFVLESKKLKAAKHTKGFDEGLLRARTQAEQYARALPADEGRPPFVVVVDVGNRIELYAEFSRSGATYTPFPDPRSHRIALDDLRRPELRDRLRQIWTDPLALDPSRESARVTREIATQLAELAKRLEADGHGAEAVAQFLMRCLFTMFAEDVKLLPSDSFRDLMIKHADQPDIAMRMLAQLWRDMDSGGFSAAIAGDVLKFNGKLFKQPDTLPLDKPQLALLIQAAKAKWNHVEPAIFGTLLERALSPNERHKLGAHYTPRAYVERLVLPTVIEPLRAEWSDAQAAALLLAVEGKPDEAAIELRRFHHRLCTVRVLDPACGSGNFLYVTLEHLKRLEGEVLNALDELGDRQTGLALGGERADAAAGETVDPHNLLGIELNPRAAAIAEVVLWIGYLQWHFRTRGDVFPPQPVIRDFRNIENRDAVLAYDDVVPELDDHGQPLTRWDGETMKVSPITGEKIPDDTARKPVMRYINPRKAAWPEADFVVGNPPYIGVRRLKSSIGDEYVQTIRSIYPEVPETCDYVMYWWQKAAQAISSGTKRFGLITTNSIVQEYSRRMLENHISEGQRIKLCFAIVQHPWVDEADGAAVGVSMAVGCNASDAVQARLGFVSDDEEEPPIYKDVPRIGTSLDEVSIHESIKPLRANSNMCFQGVVPAGDGFKLEAEDLLDFKAEDLSPYVLRKYILGKDLVQRPSERKIIDFFGLSEVDARESYPALYQRLLNRVLPERRENKRAFYREKWWLFAEPRPAMRKALEGLKRFIVTPYTAKHRPFLFVDGDTLPDAMVYAVASGHAYILGVLSSVIHNMWSDFSGGTLEDRPRYNSKSTFFPFPFPSDANEHEKTVLVLAENLDTHRKRQQAAHPELTLTGMYNVLTSCAAVKC